MSFTVSRGGQNGTNGLFLKQSHIDGHSLLFLVAPQFCGIIYMQIVMQDDGGLNEAAEDASARSS